MQISRRDFKSAGSVSPHCCFYFGDFAWFRMVLSWTQALDLRSGRNNSPLNLDKKLARRNNPQHNSVTLLRFFRVRCRGSSDGRSCRPTFSYLCFSGPYTSITPSSVFRVIVQRWTSAREREMSVEMRPRDKLLSHFKAHVDSGPNEVYKILINSNKYMCIIWGE